MSRRKELQDNSHTALALILGNYPDPVEEEKEYESSTVRIVVTS